MIGAYPIGSAPIAAQDASVGDGAVYRVSATFNLTYSVEAPGTTRTTVQKAFALAYGVRGTVQRAFTLALAVDASRTKVQRTFALTLSVQAAGGGSGIGSAVVPASRTVVFPGGTRYVVF